MEICRQNESLEIRELDPFLAELLRQIPDSVDTKNSPAAEERLFSAPAGAEEKEFRSEWKLYIVPELRRLFQSATETVRQDLEQLHCKKKPFANCTLRISIGDSFVGVDFSPSGNVIYVGGGRNDDVKMFTLASDGRFLAAGAIWDYFKSTSTVSFRSLFCARSPPAPTKTKLSCDPAPSPLAEL